MQAVVVDEIHAFAGDDRGWHLLAILARLDALAGREIQRVGLTATVGNPDGCSIGSCAAAAGEREVVLAERRRRLGGGSRPSIGSRAIDNAAKVIAALHRGEKRLVFADSRARVEAIAAALRAAGNDRVRLAHAR